MLRRSYAVAAVAAFVVALAGCGDGLSEPARQATPTPSHTPAPSPEPGPEPGPEAAWSPAEAAAADEVRDVYRSFLELEKALSAEPPSAAESYERLLAYATGVLHGRVLLGLNTLRAHDLARSGQPRSNVTVVDIDLDGPVPRATIVDCLDTTGWRLVDRAGDPVEPVDAPAELYGVSPGTFVRTVQATRHDDGRWLLNDYDRPLVQQTSDMEGLC
jgi:hypothetical protein